MFFLRDFERINGFVDGKTSTVITLTFRHEHDPELKALSPTFQFTFFLKIDSR